MKYTGKDLDEDTGLYYYNARWYDAGTGRFISEDPARDGSNWYSYVTNNPLKFVDPAGMRRVIGEDENGDLTLENPNGDLVGRSHGDDRNDGGNEPPKKDEPEKKSLWGRFVENAQNAYRKNKINELMDRLPEDVKSQLQELGISPEMIIDGMSGDFSSFSDFSGVFYRGTGMSAYGFAGLSNEAGIAYLFESGAVVDSKKYQSISAGWILDGGANAYEVLGLIPDAKWGDFMGVGGAMSIGQTIIKNTIS